MKLLQGQQIYLRALEPSDIDALYYTENNTELWHLSHTQTPFSKHTLTSYLQHAHLDIYETKQLRLVICKTETDATLGFIDVFNFDPKNKRAGIAIVITAKINRTKGYGLDALKVLVHYCFSVLHLHQLYANIEAENTASLKLFKACNFTTIGLKKDWNFDGYNFKDEYIVQLIKP